MWQGIVEAIFNIIYITWSHFLPPTAHNLQKSKVLMTLFLLFFSYIILPSFYFLADPKFRSGLKESGIMKAICSALKQKYDWFLVLLNVYTLHFLHCKHKIMTFLEFLIFVTSKNMSEIQKDIWIYSIKHRLLPNLTNLVITYKPLHTYLLTVNYWKNSNRI